MLRAFTLVYLAALFAGPARAAAPGAEYFEKHVRPLLAERCLKCHGMKKASGGLRLVSRQAALKGGDTGPALVPGQPEKSLLIKVLGYHDKPRMPPDGKLSEGQIARLREWVRQGAPWPAAAKGTDSSAEEHRRWWAYQPLRPVAVPAVQGASRALSPIDRFLLAKQEAQGLTLAAPADRRTLIRRLTFDLTGLPPTPEEALAFVSDRRPDAYERLVDRLLASPAYGERWGRHWLDVVRYADYYQKDPGDHGSNSKFELHEAWRYRDWVVTALNRDLPYDQFILHQIAGDLLPAPRGEAIYRDGLVATGFLSIGSWDHGDADKDKIVSDIVDDQIDVIGKAFLGLTLSCARCHDHKFDPISQTDYYGLAGIFYSTRTLAALGAKGDHTVLHRPPLVGADYLKKRETQLRQLGEIETRLRNAGPRRAVALVGASTPLVRAAVAVVPDDRPELLRRRDALRKQLLPAPPLALAVAEGGTPGSLFPRIQDVPLHIRGSYARLGPMVKRRLPRFFAGSAPLSTRGSGRLELARWVASKDNPLTARVIVNRVWQHHFGEGIVRTPSDFGKMGAAPSHPELLDWLAAEFIREGRSLKQLHRRLVLSAAYQQGSTVTKAIVAKDPDNRWLARRSSRRLEAEAIRDALLAVSGRLDLTQGGLARADLNRPRRSLYVATTRWDRSNYSTLFDAANPDQPVEKRTTSTVAPQALFLLNNPFALARARELVARVRSREKDEAARIRFAYELLYARPPRGDEVRLGLRAVTALGWDDYAHALLCSNELVYLD